MYSRIKRSLFGILALGVLLLLKRGESYAVNSVPIPELTVYQSGNAVKAEWSMDIAPEDVLYQTGFEVGQERPSLTWWQGSTGGQSFSSENVYEGQYTLKVVDTYTNGNWRNDSRDPIDKSIAMFYRKYIPNGTPLSVTFYAKTTTSGKIGFSGDGGWSNSIQEYPGVYLAKPAQPGDDRIVLNKTPINLSNVGFTIDTDPMRFERVYAIYRADPGTNTIYLMDGDGNHIDRYLPAGTPFKTRYWRGAWSFNTRTVYANEGWKRFSVNTFVSDYPDYDVSLRGGSFFIYTSTNGILYIDDIKMGYASKAELFRDGVKVYEGYLSDFLDTAAQDRVPPDAVNAWNVRVVGNRLQASWNVPKDRGSTYQYQIRSISKNGIPSALSEPKSITVTTGVKGYAYVIDQNPGTDPGTEIKTTSPSIDITLEKSGRYYLHLRAVDDAGNAGPVVHIPFTYGFEFQAAIEPPEASRGQKITIYASLTEPDGRRIQADSISATLPNGGSIGMRWDSMLNRYIGEYLIPDGGAPGVWPGDGSYEIRVRATKHGITKEQALRVVIRGNIKEKLYIRQIQF